MSRCELGVEGLSIRSPPTTMPTSPVDSELTNHLIGTIVHCAAGLVQFTRDSTTQHVQVR